MARMRISLLFLALHFLSDRLAPTIILSAARLTRGQPEATHAESM
jgi:hypothetical protein